MKKIVFASDSFKGSLSAEQTAELLKRAVGEVLPGCATVSVPLADGGEGTVQTVIHALGGRLVTCQAKGPLGEPVDAVYGILDNHCAIIEMAQASGLPLVPDAKRNPLITTTYGTGELILDALDQGARHLYLAIGGSATNDGGMGCMCALGARFLDEDGNVLQGKGEDLVRVKQIDLSGLDERLLQTKITVLCDVDNPLCGEHGATYTFGAQKGATDDMLQQLENGMCNYRDVIRDAFPVDPDKMPGSGAAGGLGCALMVFLKGEMRSGIETVLDLTRFDEHIKDADLIITGEGRTDWQSCHGKVLQGVGERAKKAGIPVIALSGSLGTGAESVFDHGIESVMTCVDSPMTLDEAISRTEELYLSAARRMLRLVKVGTEIIA